MLCNNRLNHCQDLAAVQKERDELLKENLVLRKEKERLNYRVNHLVKALNEEEKKHVSK